MKGPLFILGVMLVIGSVLVEMGSDLVSAIKEWDSSLGVREHIGTDGNSR